MDDLSKDARPKDSDDGERPGPNTGGPSRNGWRNKPVPRKPTPDRLHNIALHYLARYASSRENLRRVLMRRALKAAPHHDMAPQDVTELVDGAVERIARAGLLDDALYAEARSRSLARSGKSPRLIRMRLMEKGVDGDNIDQAMNILDEETGDSELYAAAALARRRRLGPYRPEEMRAERRDKDLASLARNGFRLGTALKIVDADSINEIDEMLDSAGL